MILTLGLKLHKQGVKDDGGCNWPNCSDVAAGIIYGGAELSGCPRHVITSASASRLPKNTNISWAHVVLGGPDHCHCCWCIPCQHRSLLVPPGQHSVTANPHFLPKMRCSVTMSTFGKQIWKKPWREISFLFRVCRVLRTSGLFSWRERRDQSNLARALSGTIDDVQMAVVVVGGDQISWRKEYRWEPERCEEGGEEDAVKCLLLWHPNDM